MNEKQIEDLVMKIIGIDLNHYPESTALSEITEWDSYNNIMLIGEIQKHTEKTFSLSDVEEVETIKDFREFCKNL